MAIDFTCPKCHKGYRAPDEFAGKAAKCKQCGETVRVPHPQVAAASDPLAMAGLLDEELAKAPAKKPVATAASAGPGCPACQAALAPSAILCVSCGYDLREGRKLTTVREADEAPPKRAATGVQKVAGHSARFVLGVVLSGVGALIGAVLWGGVALATGFEIRIIAWAVGLLAGLGMALGYRDGDGTIRGLVAAGMSLFGIVLGKVIILVGVLLPLMNIEDVDVQREWVAGAVARQQLQARGVNVDGDIPDAEWDRALADARKQVATISDEEVERRFNAELEKAEDEEAAAEKAEMAADVENGDAREVRAQPGAAADVKAAPPAHVAVPPVADARPNDKEDPSIVGLFFVTMFRPMDILWIVFAVATAFKVGSTAGSD